MKKGLKILGIIIVLLIVVAGIGMKVSEIYPIGLGVHSKVFQQDGLAAEGYDVVAYFEQNEATKGSPDFSTEWNDVTWQFSSSKNLKSFKVNPKKYAPAYGGHCSFAAGKGFAVHASPELWFISNDKLLFFSNEEVKTEGLSNIEELIVNADKNWK